MTAAPTAAAAAAAFEQRPAADRRPGRGRGDLVHSEEEMNQILRNLQQQEEQYELGVFFTSAAASTPGGLTGRPLRDEARLVCAPSDRRDSLDDFEMRYKRTLAVVTSMELDPRALKFKYLNHNGTRLWRSWRPRERWQRELMLGLSATTILARADLETGQGLCQTRRRFMKTAAG